MSGHRTQRRRLTPRRLACAVTAAVLLAPSGCNRRSTAAQPTTATHPAASGTSAAAPARSASPAAASTASALAASTMTIGNRTYTFGPAHITFDTRDGALLAQVFADPAPDNPASDSFFLEMPLDVDSSSQIDDATWQYTNQSNDRVDSLDAIIIERGTRQLQPRDVTATFRRLSADTIEVRVNGFFNVFAGREGALAIGTVPVQATLRAHRQP